MTNTFTGTLEADVLLGTSDDDVFSASAGDDRVWGGLAGNDTLILTGRLSDYTVRDNGNGSYTVTDLRAEGDGVNVVRSIDNFQFTDRTVTEAELLAQSSNVVTGSHGDDTLLGTGRNDRFEGGAGDDRIWGGTDGEDVAVLSGQTADYKIKDNGNGSFTITDLRGVDGVDVIRDIELLQFSDGAVGTSDFMASMPNEVSGSSGDDVQLGTAGNDKFTSSGGDDRIWGGTGGDDLLIMSGNFDDYAIVDNRNGSYQVIDLRSGAPDGTDVVRDIGTFQFADRLSTLAEFKAAHPNNYIFDGVGTGANDILIGSANDDRLQGGGGKDRIWGGSDGNDTAVFTGNFADYEITDNDNGAITVKDMRLGSPDGTAVVRDVEQFEFEDGTVASSNILSGANQLATTLRGTAADDTVSGAHTDGLFDAHTNDKIVGNAGDDFLRGGPGDDLLIGDSIAIVDTHTLTSTPATDLERFAYEPGLYQAINGQLVKLDPLSGNYTPIGVDNPNYNAAGLNPADGYAYGVGTGGPIRGHLLRIGADGAYESLGSGFPAVAAGGIGGDGDLYLRTGAMKMTVIDLESLEQSVINFAGEKPPSVHDLVFVDNDAGGIFYGVSVNAVLVAYNMADLSISTASIDGLLVGKGAYGAGWTSSDGGLYFSHNSTGNIYGISGLENMEPSGALLSVGSKSTINDGFSFGTVALPEELLGEGGDNLLGGAGNDTLRGGEGNDFLDGGSGADILEGGADIDHADYSRAADGVHANLAVGGIAGEAAGDTYATIENLIGSHYQDTLIGDAGNNEIAGRAGDDTLSGGAGDDVLRGEGGADVLDGGDGHDVATYYFSETGVSVDLATGTGLGGEAEGDTLTSIEAVQGSNIGDDILLGSNLADLLQGFGGDDVLEGRDGADIVHGGDGADTINGGNDDDFLLGQSGNDQLDGGAGADNVQGGEGNDVLRGGDGVDRLWAADGDDHLIGGTGDDFLRGGNGADVFMFTDAGGNDTVLDFEVGVDQLDFSLMANVSGLADLAIDQTAENRVVISYPDSDQGGELTVDLSGAATLTGYDFAF